MTFKTLNQISSFVFNVEKDDENSGSYYILSKGGSDTPKYGTLVWADFLLPFSPEEPHVIDVLLST